MTILYIRRAFCFQEQNIISANFISSSLLYTIDFIIMSWGGEGSTMDISSAITRVALPCTKTAEPDVWEEEAIKLTADAMRSSRDEEVSSTGTSHRLDTWYTDGSGLKNDHRGVRLGARPPSSPSSTSWAASPPFTTAS